MISTERLRCEPLRSDHASLMYPLLSEPNIYEHLPGQPPKSLEALQKRYDFLSGRKSPDGTEHWLNWILFPRKTAQPIGFFQATVRPDSCSIAYVLNPDFWGQGYASECCRALIKHLFDTFEDIPSVRAEIAVGNVASIRLVERLGFEHVGDDPDEGDVIYALKRPG